ncbi:hypothetical protein LEN26_010973 [Aphanomyces euteiches]|nr:hypothetical protein AeMF1_019846 [Aphanomyces euteiches]KAH9120781.1 hypothetical protein LEN26_010973 [Aphanomyces euteiches]KAH9181611.1 hypothetical protein AeNC1_016413 [Aphanomyces euteiches]
MSIPPASLTQSELEQAGAMEIMSNEFGELRMLIEEQKKEMDSTRVQNRMTKSTSTTTEAEAKDLLRKVRFSSITNDINALKTKMSTFKTGKQGNGKWCFICRKMGDHVAQDHDDFDLNYRESKVKGGLQKGAGTSKPPFKKRASKKTRGSDDDDITYNINAISNTETHDQEAHWTLGNCATGHVTGNRHYVQGCHGNATLTLPNGGKIKGCHGVARIALDHGVEEAILH